MGHGVAADTQVLAGRAHRHARHVLTGMLAMFVNQVGMAGGFRVLEDQIEESRQQCLTSLGSHWSCKLPVRCVLITESELFSCL